MGKQDMPKLQTYVLKVNNHCVCDGCKDKVKKLIQKTEGVYQTNVDAEQGEVVVSGVVDPDKLIKKLKKSGKHAELWGGHKGNLANSQSFPANQFNSFGNGKGGKDSKPQQQKGGQGQQKGGHFEPVNMKGAKDMKMPSKDQKSVKFNLPEEFDASDDDFDASEASDDEFDDESDEDFEDDECESGHGQQTANKTMHMMGNGYDSKGGPAISMINGHPMNASKNGDGKGASMNFKKGGAISFPFEMKGNVEKPHGKDGKGGKKRGGDVDGSGEKNKKGGKNKGGGAGGNKNGGADKSGLLGFLGFGKKSKGEAVAKMNKSNNVELVTVGARHHKVKKGKNSGDFDDFPEMDAMSRNIKGGGVGGGGNGGKGRNGNGGGGGGGKVGQMGPSSAQMGLMNTYPLGQMSKMGNFPMDQARGFSAVHGLPAHAAMNGGGYNYQGQAIQPQPSYQQYMPIMMNPQQHKAANGNGGMYQPMIYGNHHPSMNYMPPPPMPSHPMNDPMTHIFSDENTESCSIM